MSFFANPHYSNKFFKREFAIRINKTRNMARTKCFTKTVGIRTNTTYAKRMRILRTHINKTHRKIKVMAVITYPTRYFP